MASTPTLVQTPKTTPMSFVNADGTTKKTIATAGTSGTKVVAIKITSTDTVTRLLQFWLTRSATSYLLGTVSVTTLAGTDGATATIDGMGTLFPCPVDNDGQKYFFLESGDTLQASATVAVTAAKEIDIVTTFGNF